MPRPKLTGPYKADDAGGIYIIGLIIGAAFVVCEQGLYIGQAASTRSDGSPWSIEDRMKQHFRDAYDPNNKSKNTVFYQTIRRAGIEGGCNGRQVQYAKVERYPQIHKSFSFQVRWLGSRANEC
jgi:hypothetical protein